MLALNRLFSRFGILCQAEERAWGNWGWKEAGSQNKLPGPDYVEYVFALLGSIITCQMYKPSSDQAQGTLELKSIFPI